MCALGEIHWRYFPAIIGSAKRQLQIVEYGLQEVGRGWKAVLKASSRAQIKRASRSGFTR